MMKIIKSEDLKRSDLFLNEEKGDQIEKSVKEIIDLVKKEGDSALRALSERFDHVLITDFEVRESEWIEASTQVQDEFRDILKKAYENIREFHQAQVQEGFEITRSDGSILGQKITPIEKVGIYVPGGKAAYPSTVLMNAIPAKIAGCKEIVIATPPNQDGKIHPNILEAAKIAGVTRIYKMGGAQAIAGLAYGTESIGKVDKIVGPGNAYVAEAKKQVFGQVGIDMIAGPSEILVLADDKADPSYVAADLLSQAEHDEMATALLISNSQDLAIEVQAEVSRQLELLQRKDIASQAISKNGKIIITQSITEAIDLANKIAPEHLELYVEDSMSYLDQIKHAGSIFLGPYCPEAMGDYMAGTNHTLPTSGTARFSSPLSVDDFIKKSQYMYYDETSFKSLGPSVIRFAEEEGLEAHGKSVKIRLGEEDE